MYLRIKAARWHEIYFKGSVNPPSVQSIKKWIEKGSLAGRKLGTMHFVFCNNQYEPIELADMPVLSRQTRQSQEEIPVIKESGNSIADAIIKRKLSHVSTK